MGEEEEDWFRRDSACSFFGIRTLNTLSRGEHVIEFNGLDVVFRLHWNKEKNELGMVAFKVG